MRSSFITALLLVAAVCNAIPSPQEPEIATLEYTPENPTRPPQISPPLRGSPPPKGMIAPTFETLGSVYVNPTNPSGPQPSATGAPSTEAASAPGGLDITYASTNPVPGVASSNYKCAVTATSFDPKEMSVKKGDTITFQVSSPATYTIRTGLNATSCVPLANGATQPQGGNPFTLNYTVPQDATGKIYFYNVQGTQCTDKDMSATLTVGDGNSTTSANSTVPFASSADSSSVPTLASVFALTFVSALLQS